MKTIACLAVLFLSLPLMGKDTPEKNIIRSMQVDKNHLTIQVDPSFKEKFLKDNFFATYEEDIDLELLDPSLLVLPFIANVISIIWISGRTYYIDALDEDFNSSLVTIKKVFKRMYPDTSWDGELIPRKLVKNNHTAQSQSDKKRTALLFSGGLDSVTSSFYHRDEEQLLITVNGHWDLPLKNRELWRARQAELRSFGEKHGHTSAFIHSNYYEFLNRWVLDHYSHEITSWRIFTVEGIGWAGVCAPLMALKGYDTLLHASTITWEYNFPAAANPFIDDNLYFGGMRLKHDLFDMNRLGKCAFIAQLCRDTDSERPYIRVCEERALKNCCSHCQKCIRTIIELVVVGEDPRAYGFDCDVSAILAQSKEFVKAHKTGSTTIWHFMHIQKELRKQKDQGKTVPEELEWLLPYNLKKKITDDIKNQRKLDWRTFVDLLPGIKVPDTIELGF
jgi:hypothetical protein